jgi:hypothetical protein
MHRPAPRISQPASASFLPSAWQAPGWGRIGISNDVCLPDHYCGDPEACLNRGAKQAMIVESHEASTTRQLRSLRRRRKFAVDSLEIFWAPFSQLICPCESVPHSGLVQQLNERAISPVSEHIQIYDIVRRFCVSIILYSLTVLKTSEVEFFEEFLESILQFCRHALWKIDHV